jgi:cell filamentation protein
MSFKPAVRTGEVNEVLVQWRIDNADAALALANTGPGDSEHRVLIRRVATGEITATEAVAIAVQRAGVGTDKPPLYIIREWDDYNIPGTTALRNNFADSEHPYGVEDPEVFRKLELEISRIRIVELAINPIVGDLDYDHMKAIHRHIFGDIFQWAGQERIGPESSMVRFAPDAVNYAPGDSAAPMIPYRFYPGSQIAEAASIQYASVAELLLRAPGMSRREVIDRMSEHGGELQTIHSFRDGHNRTLFVWALQLFEAAGYPADPAVFVMGAALRESLMHARHQNQATGRHDAYLRTLDAALDGYEPQGSLVEAR